MKPEELRIGNYVIHNNKILQCNGAFISNFETNSLIEKTEPIPLTEDWLIKFGYEEYKNDSGRIGFWHKEYNDLAVQHEDEFYSINAHWWSYLGGQDLMLRDYEILNTLEYVHQLQNLYQALTGKELEIQTIEA